MRIGGKKGIIDRAPRNLVMAMVVFLVVSVLSLVISTEVMTPNLNESGAVDSSLGASADIEPLLVFYVSSVDADLGTANVAGGTLSSKMLTTNVSTNNPTGYTLTMGMQTTEQCLRMTGVVTACASVPANEKIIPLATVNVATGSFTMNSWGASLNSTQWNAVPASSSAATVVKTEPKNIVGSTANVWFAARANMAMKVGEYSNTVVVSAVAQPRPVPVPLGGMSGNKTTGDSVTLSFMPGAGNVDYVYEVRLNGMVCENMTIFYSNYPFQYYDEVRCAVPYLGEIQETINVAVRGVYGDVVPVTSTMVWVPPAATEKWAKAADSMGDALASIDMTNSGEIVVDVDANMIPIVNLNVQGVYSDVWCDYYKQKWCNAVTVKPSRMAYYQSAKKGTAIAEEDIMGYWVYVPRYAYEVQRWYSWHTIATRGSPFNVRFETATTPKKTAYPGTDNTTTYTYGETCLTPPTSTVPQGNNGGPDYRTQCGVPRTYPTSAPYDRSTWATHPAFTIDKNSNGVIEAGEELNGFWVGKFENGMDTWCYNTSTLTSICGTNLVMDGTPGKEVYIKAAKAPQTMKNTSALYSQVLNFSKNPLGLTGGSVTVGAGAGMNLMNLAATSQTVMPNNRMWGAIAYLSLSLYGSCTTSTCTKVNNNGYVYSVTSNTTDTTGTPWAPTTTSFGYQTGCTSSKGSMDDYDNTCRTYSSVGRGLTTSTTQNVYGVYDLAGGASEFVLASYTTSSVCPSDIYWAAGAPSAGWCDVYKSSDGFATVTAWGAGMTRMHMCSFNTCGGQALYEVLINRTPISTFPGLNWDNDQMIFVDPASPWFTRGMQSNISGSYANRGDRAGIWSSLYNSVGTSNNYTGTRTILVP